MFDPAKFRKVQSLDRKSTKVHSVICAIIGDGSITVTWKKNGVASLPSHIKPVGNSLVINDLQASDGGQYECSATGPYNSIKATITVIVFGELDVGLASLICKTVFDVLVCSE